MGSTSRRKRRTMRSRCRRHFRSRGCRSCSTRRGAAARPGTRRNSMKVGCRPSRPAAGRRCSTKSRAARRRSVGSGSAAARAAASARAAAAGAGLLPRSRRLFCRRCTSAPHYILWGMSHSLIQPAGIFRPARCNSRSRRVSGIDTSRHRGIGTGMSVPRKSSWGCSGSRTNPASARPDAAEAPAEKIEPARGSRVLRRRRS